MKTHRGEVHFFNRKPNDDKKPFGFVLALQEDGFVKQYNGSDVRYYFNKDTHCKVETGKHGPYFVRSQDISHTPRRGDKLVFTLEDHPKGARVSKWAFADDWTAAEAKMPTYRVLQVEAKWGEDDGTDLIDGVRQPLSSEETVLWEGTNVTELSVKFPTHFVMSNGNPVVIDGQRLVFDVLQPDGSEDGRTSWSYHLEHLCEELGEFGKPKWEDVDRDPRDMICGIPDALVQRYALPGQRKPRECPHDHTRKPRTSRRNKSPKDTRTSEVKSVVEPTGSTTEVSTIQPDDVAPSDTVGTPSTQPTSPVGD